MKRKSPDMPYIVGKTTFFELGGWGEKSDNEPGYRDGGYTRNVSC